MARSELDGSSPMDLLEKFAPKKKKKTLVLTNVGKRAVGGGGITYPPDLWI